MNIGNSNEATNKTVKLEDKIKTVAYGGIEGSFSYIAADKICTNAEKISCKSFKEAYEKVENGECDAAVLPIENSFAGEVGQVSDLMFTGSLYINGVYELAVSQNLLGVPGSSLSSIKTVLSHQQALDQCAVFLYDNGISTRAFENTAVAAREVSKINDISIGAVASIETAELYGLKVLAENINESAHNITKFALFTKANHYENNDEQFSTFIMMFTVPNGPGTLAKPLTVLGDYGYSMRVIRSRPVKDINWRYYFYTEVEGRISSENGEKMIEEFKKCCSSLKILGTYKPELRL